MEQWMLRAPPVKFTGPPRPRRQIPPALRAPRGPPSKASIPGGPRQNRKRLEPLLPPYAPHAREAWERFVTVTLRSRICATYNVIRYDLSTRVFKKTCSPRTARADLPLPLVYPASVPQARRVPRSENARLLHAARCGTQRTLTSILRRQADPPGWALQGWNLCNDSMAHPALDYVPPCVFCPRKGHRPAREGVLKS